MVREPNPREKPKWMSELRVAVKRTDWMEEEVVEGRQRRKDHEKVTAKLPI